MVNTLCESCWQQYGEWFVEEKVLCTTCAYLDIKNRFTTTAAKDAIEPFDRKAVTELVKKIEGLVKYKNG